MPTKYSLHAVRQKYKETHPGVDDTIGFTISDEPMSTVYHIEHPLMQTNKTKRALAAAQKDGSDYDLAKALLGDQWGQFEDDGGQASDVLLLINQITEELTDTMPDGSPTQR
ncbi:hypothetical protein [Bifidobacterium xylocopae]|uniref:Uncharacterized protein n=1 Tax=Bifidobacterium xylocopae TaxID=2493119 RepID=A0A366KFV2_9BIFI|nr:hypothetical protein [Bifidobacterium xylocopae]RBQ00069.1 hypothetical protein CRD59_00990 [Bifidobacterium xylocopae]